MKPPTVPTVVKTCGGLTFEETGAASFLDKIRAQNAKEEKEELV